MIKISTIKQEPKKREMTEGMEKNWKKPDGSLISCTEKVKVLNENYEEIKNLLQDAVDDAVLMGCSEENVRKIYLELVNSTKAAYPEMK